MLEMRCRNYLYRLGKSNFLNDVEGSRVFVTFKQFLLCLIDFLSRFLPKLKEKNFFNRFLSGALDVTYK